MTAAIFEKPRATRKATGGSAGSEEAKLRQLSQILYDASRADGANFDSGYSLRLLRIASEIALDEADGFDKRSDQHCANTAFDLAAIVGSARRVPSDLPLPAGLLALIEQARVLLSDLCDCEDCFDDERSKPAVPSSPFLNGYTPAQLREILAHIASSTEAATEILLDVEAHIGGEEWTPSQCITTVRVAAQALRLVGAMADQAAGTGIMGGPIEWSMADRDMKGDGHA
ncbi:MAG: hypothetical protein DI587_18460 [Variovorax paradoxus]|nr:MAG: hypothetical protein DI583_18460 [Variovorax paradoxus]PZQ08449.1 MAG: hypothetical protein DI587_18460 [Variovorax paradoxus]